MKIIKKIGEFFFHFAASVTILTSISLIILLLFNILIIVIGLR